jgi:hypothetical protein
MVFGGVAHVTGCKILAHPYIRSKTTTTFSSRSVLPPRTDLLRSLPPVEGDGRNGELQSDSGARRWEVAAATSPGAEKRRRCREQGAGKRRQGREAGSGGGTGMGSGGGNAGSREAGIGGDARRRAAAVAPEVGSSGGAGRRAVAAAACAWKP